MVQRAFINMLIYLDNCCLNRPYDDQANLMVKLESEAKLSIQDFVLNGKICLAWSFILDFENAANPYEDRRNAISEWKSVSELTIEAIEAVHSKAKTIEVQFSIKPKDALHLSCALVANCEYFITTDKILAKKAGKIKGIKVVSPLKFTEIISGGYDAN